MQSTLDTRPVAFGAAGQWAPRLVLFFLSSLTLSFPFSPFPFLLNPLATLLQLMLSCFLWCAMCIYPHLTLSSLLQHTVCLALFLDSLSISLCSFTLSLSILLRAWITLWHYLGQTVIKTVYRRLCHSFVGEMTLQKSRFLFVFLMSISADVIINYIKFSKL